VEEKDDTFPFVGRVDEIGRLRRLLRKSPSRETGLNIVITGERGVGKTRLMQETATQARKLGFKSLYHRCQQWDRYRPFTTLAGLTKLLLGRPPGWIPRSLDTVVKAISELYPDLHFDDLEAELVYWLLGAQAVSEHIANLDERSRKGMMSTLFGTLIKHQLRRQPLLLLTIDDLHYSDAFSSNYLVSTVLGKGAVLLVGAPSSVSLHFRHQAEEIAISPFTYEEVKQLLVKRFGVDFPSDMFVPQLREITGGNALYLTQLLASVPTDSAAASTLSKMMDDTRQIKAFEVVLARLHKLDSSALNLIKAASVIEDYFPLPLLKRMCGTSASLKTSLRHLRQHKLASVEKHKGTAFFRFDHGIVREAAYSLLSAEEKNRLHASCAETLKHYYRKRPDKHLMTIAGHYDKAGDRNNAAETYFEAGRYLYRVGDLPSAEEALTMSEWLFDDREKKLEVMVRLIRVLDHQAKVEDSVKVAQRFFDSNPPVKMQADVLGSMARLHGITGSLVKALECGEKAIKLAEECGAQKELAGAYIALTPVLAYMGRMSEALSYGARGYGLTEELGDKGMMAAALNALGIVNAIDGSLQEARGLFERVSEMWSKMDHLHYAATAKINLAIAMTEMGEYREAVQRFAEATDLFEKMGAVENSALAKHHAAGALLELGEYNKGWRLLESAISLFQALGRSPGAGASFLLKASYLLKMGKAAEAVVELDHAWQILAEEGRWRDKAIAVDVKMEVATYTGDMDKALEESEKFLQEASSGEVKAIYYGALLTRLRVLLEAKNVDKSREIAGLIEEQGFTGQNPRAEAYAKALLSRLEADSREFDKARRLLEEAITSSRLSSEMHALSHLWLGSAMLEAGEREQAGRHLKEARNVFAKLVDEGYRTRELELTEKLLAEVKS